MKIKLTTCVVGAWTGNAGDEVERPDKEATNLIRAGFAVPVKAAATKLEKAVVSDKLETATKA